jgi:hypothetical protein
MAGGGGGSGVGAGAGAGAGGGATTGAMTGGCKHVSTRSAEAMFVLLPGVKGRVLVRVQVQAGVPQQAQ